MIALAAMALFMSSCSNDDEIFQYENLEGTPIVITAGVGNMKTRGGYDNSNLPPYFYITIDQEGTEYDYTDVKMTKNSDNSYSPPEGISLIWGSKAHEATFIAYSQSPNDDEYPTSKYNWNGDVFSVQTSQTSDSEWENSDLLGANSSVSGDIIVEGGSVNIRFRHLMSKLEVALTWSDELKAIDRKNISVITFGNFGTSVKFDLEEGTFTSNNEYKNILGTRPLEPMSPEIIFAPYCTEPYLQIQVNTNGGSYSGGESHLYRVNIPEPAGGFKSGYRYTMNVCIGGNSVETGTVSIAKGWDNNTTGGNFVTE
jgi:hypothetical protein